MARSEGSWRVAGPAGLRLLVSLFLILTVASASLGGTESSASVTSGAPPAPPATTAAAQPPVTTGAEAVPATAPARPEIAAAPPVTQPEKVLSSQPTEGGELERIEGSAATARRVFKDSAGRTVREIIYSDRPPFSMKAGEVENLRECGTRVLQYDEAGRLVLKAQYNGQRVLIAYTEQSYWPEGGNRLTSCFTPAGIRHWETRYPRKGKETYLEFDWATGKRLLYISGPVPDDVDLADGWGPQTGALRYGITVSGYCISCTIKNVSDTTSSLAADTIGRLIRPELRDAEGKMVPYKKDAVANLSKSRHAGHDSLAPNHASDEYYLLGDWYGKLPPGRYSLLLRRRATGREFILTSNTVQFVVEVR